MRDLLVLSFLVAFLPLALRSPLCAFLLWSWGGMIAIQSHVYGFMLSVPVVQLFALISLVQLVMTRRGGQTAYWGGGTSIIMLLLILHGLMCALLAYSGLPRNWELFSNMAKTVLLCLIIPVFLTSRERLNIYVILIAISVSFHGMLDGLKYLSSAGNHNAHGIPKFGDNNHYAIVLLMVIPLLIYVGRHAERWLLRWGVIAVGLLTFLAVLATNSRGGLLSLIVMGLWLIMLSKRKLVGMALAAMLAMLVVQLAPDRWFDRMDTIKEANDDDSFMGRVTAWKRASAIAVENPVFGGGYHAGQFDGIFDRFRYEPGLLGFVETPDVSYAAATHSIYFEVLGDQGFVGLLLFVALLGNAFYNWWRIRRLARKNPLQLGWAHSLADMLSACLLVYAVGGAALSAAYFELPYYLVMLLQMVWVQVRDHASHSAAPNLALRRPQAHTAHAQPSDTP
ncbi:putative O-glycosylation ligase, exosortase A system-associated [Aquabacterium lacunae]|uniref:Putative O-glycosylation ligase, exosortase A system-associated n=1 Tax=Aquabacterium lacunae TaxID=2528630 RepID=A0A4V2JFK1_9BURK|nr:putative O-glycosylation ligase, exosortase A system-associated [Aquabacterium lacunae]TBO30240.1 putative O-glycosylation ligase, exosortase A system-associated [Aquabacterium lacunae]